MDKPLISVVVPIYNVEKYINRCVDSILNQTYKNIQVILVDDGSPDNCGRIIDEYASMDKRVFAVHKKNGGISSARNKGLEYVTGSYLTFCDSDDWLDLDMYEKMITALIRYNGDVCSSNQSICNDVVVEENVLREYLLFGDVNVSNKMFRCSELTKSFRFQPGDVAIDIKGCFDLFRNVKKWVQIPGAYYNFRQNNISYGRSGFSTIDTNAIKMAELVADEAKCISDEVYECACCHVLHAEFNMINKVAIWGFKKEESKSYYDQNRKYWEKDIRNNIRLVLRTQYFSRNEKIQMLLLSISYNVFMFAKKQYSKKNKVTNKEAIKC